MYAAQHLLFFISISPHLRHDLWLQIGTETDICPSNDLLWATMSYYKVRDADTATLFCKGGM